MTDVKWKWRSDGPASCHYLRLGDFEATVRKESDTDWAWAVEQVAWPEVKPDDWDDDAFSKDPEPCSHGYEVSEQDAKSVAWTMLAAVPAGAVPEPAPEVFDDFRPAAGIPDPGPEARGLAARMTSMALYERAAALQTLMEERDWWKKKHREDNESLVFQLKRSTAKLAERRCAVCGRAELPDHTDAFGAGRHDFEPDEGSR